MSETHALLNKLTALRQQLELAQQPCSATDAPATTRTDAPHRQGRMWRLERQVAGGAEWTTLLDTSLRQLAQQAATEAGPLPRQLTARARRLLGLGQEVLRQLRTLADQVPLQDGTDPLAILYREAVALTGTILRLVQAFPDAPSAQLQLCDGLEVMLRLAEECVASLSAAVAQRGRETMRVDRLADLLTRLHDGRVMDIQPLLSLAETLLDEVRGGAPLRFLTASAEEPARFVACHSLTTAQVAARLVRHDPDLRRQPLEPVVAALLHDVGMLALPRELLARAGALNETERRALEEHVRVGVALAGRLLPSGPWLAETIAGHHERLDGTGYPDGLREMQLSPLARLLAVCDVYSALCSPRPYRPARDTRTALTDTLLLAERGLLDRGHAERLLHLSFYPAGTAVELADGAVALVVATHPPGRDLLAPARPVVAILTDADGNFLPAPLHLDLAHCEERSVVRSLSVAERRQRLGRRYPTWV